jgi:hypothetical protein
MRIMAAFYEDFRNLSAYAEDHGLCPWRDASTAAKSFLCSWTNAPADSATGG